MMPQILHRGLFWQKLKFSRGLALIELYLRVEDKVFRSASVLTVVNGGGVQVGQGGVQHLANSFVQSFVLRQRARDLELLDDHLEDQTTDFKLN